MQEVSDSELLRRYAQDKSEQAFATLVERHINLVYSAAMRHISSPHQAEEIAQAVFIILAKKANRLGPRTFLPGWLYHTARLTAANHLRAEIRRAHREQEAHMRSATNESEPEIWTKIAPLLDHALASLSETDRNAIVLRFFQNKSMNEVGVALHSSENAAKMRVSRAVERLRRFFLQRGVTLSAAALTAAISASSVQAAPLGLAASVSASACAQGALASVSTLTLIRSTLQVMAWSKLKTAVVAVATLMLATGTTTVIIKEVIAHRSAVDSSLWQLNSTVFARAPEVLILRPTQFPQQGGWINVKDQCLGMNQSLEPILSIAYNMSQQKMILPPDLPQERFDFMLTLRERPKERLQEELRRRFGLIAHRETREMDVLLLRGTNPTAPGLQESASPAGSMNSGRGSVTIRKSRFASLALHVQGKLGLPIIDQTGLDGEYDISLAWQPEHDPEREMESYRQALQDQLGLELVPSREPIEVLIVERVK